MLLNIQKRKEESKLVGKGPKAAGQMVLGAELLVQKKKKVKISDSAYLCKTGRRWTQNPEPQPFQE